MSVERSELNVERSAPKGAVFLSYASQDAEAAKRICDALRTSGVEVWFDAEGGLEHGDEWDAKIRRQIKECVLFIAVISANTQAREEGISASSGISPPSAPAASRRASPSSCPS